jgi:BlaI family transcriptional regulator, penicillinase repressor
METWASMGNTSPAGCRNHGRVCCGGQSVNSRACSSCSSGAVGRAPSFFVRSRRGLRAPALTLRKSSYIVPDMAKAPRPALPRRCPMAAEREILRELHRRGPSTVRQVHQALDRQMPTATTTPLKQLQIMTEKGLVLRDESERAHVDSARQPFDTTRGTLLDDLLDRAFAGSSARLVLQALTSRPTAAEGLVEIRCLLDELEGDSR